MPDILTQLFIIIAPIIVVVSTLLFLVLALMSVVFMIATPIILGYIIWMFVRDETKIKNDEKAKRLRQERQWETERNARITRIQDARHEADS